jgi:hypothetical protein
MARLSQSPTYGIEAASSRWRDAPSTMEHQVYNDVDVNSCRTVYEKTFSNVNTKTTLTSMQVYVV